MSRKLGLGVCTLFVAGLLVGCGGSDESIDSGDQHLEEPADPAASEPASPVQVKVDCTLTSAEHEATANGQIKIDSKNKLVPGSTIKMAFKDGPSANLTVKEGTVKDMKAQSGQIVLTWHKVVDLVDITIDLDGTKKSGKSTSSVGGLDFNFKTACTFAKI